LLRKKLVEAYSTLQSQIDPSLGYSIPANAKYSDQDIFRKLIHRQNQYLVHHRNIPVDGIYDTLLFARTTTDQSVLDEILRGAQLTRIDSCPTHDYSGRYNFITTEWNFMEAVEWIDTDFPGIIAALPESERGKLEGCLQVLDRISGSPMK
jgi:hypothetical protein